MKTNLFFLEISSRRNFIRECRKYFPSQFTCVRHNGQSVVDYAIVPKEFLFKIRTFEFPDCHKYLPDHVVANLGLTLSENSRKFTNRRVMSHRAPCTKVAIIALDNLQILSKKSLAEGKNLFVAFLDFTSALDNVVHERL